MPIDRRRVKELKEAEGPKLKAEEDWGRIGPDPMDPIPYKKVPGKKARPPGVLKHLRKIRNFVLRMQAGEDVETLWGQMTRDLRELERARQKVTRHINPEVWDWRGVQAREAAVEIAAWLSGDRRLAAALGHPEWADLHAKVAMNAPTGDPDDITRKDWTRWSRLIDALEWFL